jgi:hypothetical protein
VSKRFEGVSFEMEFELEILLSMKKLLEGDEEW